MKNLIPVIIVLALIVYIGSICDNDTNKQDTTPDVKTTWLDRENKGMAYLMIEDFVKRSLISPGSAKFPGIFKRYDHVKYLTEQKYSIISYVDSQNSFGALLRTNFTGVIKQISEDEWELISLKIN